MARGEYEPVASGPLRVGRVVPHQLLEEHVGGGGQAHRRTGMAVADLLYGIHGQDTDGIDRLAVQVGPLFEVCGGRLGAHPESGLLSTCRIPVSEGAPVRCRAYPCGASRPCPSASVKRRHRRGAGRVSGAPPRGDGGVESDLARDAPTRRQHEPTPDKNGIWATSRVAWYAQVFTGPSRPKLAGISLSGVCVTAVESRPAGVVLTPSPGAIGRSGPASKRSWR